MKYRAVAVGIAKDGHPLQSYAIHEATILKWASQTANTEQCAVEVFVFEERLVHTIKLKHDSHA